MALEAGFDKQTDVRHDRTAARADVSSPAVESDETRSERWRSATTEIDLRAGFPPRAGLISVVITTRNRADMVGRAIESVLCSPLIDSSSQVIVVDDDSEDETEEVVRAYGVTYARVTCRSMSGSKNAGFALVHTPYVTFLDDDDAWLPGNMEAQLRALDDHPRAGFAYGITQCATDDLEPLPFTYPSPPLASGIVPRQLHLDYPQLGVVLFRREVIAEAGGFDLGLPYYQDGDMMIRVAAGHEIVGVTVVGMLHRVRGPGRPRADYHWSNRNATTWRPKHVGIGWRTTARYIVGRKALYYGRFIEDAAVCARAGHRRDALVCLARAMWVSPAHAIRHARSVAMLLLVSAAPGSRTNCPA